MRTDHVNNTPALLTMFYICLFIFPNFLTIFTLITILGNAHRPCKLYLNIINKYTWCLSIFHCYLILFWGHIYLLFHSCFCAISFFLDSIFHCYFISIPLPFHCYFIAISYIIAISLLFHSYFIAISGLLVPDKSNQTAHVFWHHIVLPPEKMFRLHANYPIDQEESYKTVRYID